MRVSTLSDMFERSLFPFAPRMPAKPNLLPTHHPCQTSNPMWSCSITSSNLVTHWDTSLPLIWAPKILRLSLISDGWVVRWLPAWCEWFSLSSAGRVAIDVWHRARLGWNHLLPWSLSISCRFLWNPAPDGIDAISFTFYNLSGLGARGFSFFEGFARRYAISDLGVCH